jgi:hypothetical protein
MRGQPGNWNWRATPPGVKNRPAMKRLLPMLLLMAVPTGAVSAAPAVRIMVVESKKVVLPEPFEKVSLAGEMERQLTEGGCAVAGVCTDGDCAARAREAGATDVLTVSADYRRDRYSCSVRVETRAVTGAVKQTNNYGGDTCPAADVVAQTKSMAAAACKQLKAQTEREVPIQAPATGGKEAGADRGVSLTGVGLLGGGAVATGLGAYLWYLHGRCAHSGVVAGQSRCGDTYDTRLVGIPVTLVGVAAMGVGGWMLWHGESTAVSVGPGQIFVAGRFR